MQPTVRIITVNAILVLTNGFAALRAYQNIYVLFNAEKKKKENFFNKTSKFKKSKTCKNLVGLMIKTVVFLILEFIVTTKRKKKL